MKTNNTAPALHAWYDVQSHQNLTHLINCLEDEPNPLEAVTAAREAYAGPGHDPMGNEYCKRGCTSPDYRYCLSCIIHY